MSTEYAQRRFIADNRREAVIIAPSNAGHALENNLVDAFGGLTRTVGFGVWFNPDTKSIEREIVFVYTIAMLDIADNRHKLLTIASQFRTESKQHTVYVRLPAGNVIMLDKEYV